MMQSTETLSHFSKIEWKWYKYFPWIGMLGSMLILLSWLFQNYFTNGLIEKRLELDRTQAIINSEKTKLNQWNILYMQEIKKEKPNLDIVKAAAFRLLLINENIDGYAAARIQENKNTVKKLSIEKTNAGRI